MAMKFGEWTLGLDGDDAPGRDLIGGKPGRSRACKLWA